MSLKFRNRITYGSGYIYNYLTATILMICAGTGLGHAATIQVPAEQPTIQSAINASTSADTILVAPGTYFENIDFLDKNLVVASHFIIGRNSDYIFSTIINGSNPIQADSASCVRIINSQDSTTQLTGFTITGGTGTIWEDQHGAGTYREGGGILTEYSSPIIQYNLIINNEATEVSEGLTSAGGGGIRCGDGNPHIRNNIIMHNRGRYGGGVVLNYATGEVRNNVIAFNIGGEDFAGSGLWKYGNGGDAIVENNTIYGNVSALDGGGVYVGATTMTLRNNVIWANEAPDFAQVFVEGATVTTEYCNVEGGRNGIGNIDIDPKFFGQYFYLDPSSPCIDSGSEALELRDRESPISPGLPGWPAMGSLRNDMGAYGGPGSFPFEKITVHTDTTIGWAPFPVTFRAMTSLAVNSWTWDFGDGNNGSGNSPIHTYFLGGLFYPTVTADTGGGTVSYTSSQSVVAIADTMSASYESVRPGSTVVITISANNSAPLTRINVPVEFSGDLELEYVGISTEGCRTDYFEETQVYASNWPAGFMAIRLITSANGSLPELPPGNGPILKIIMQAPANFSPGQTAPIIIDGLSSYQPEYIGSLLNYQPQVLPGIVTGLSCCITRGDVDGSGGAFPVNIMDITYFVDFFFRGGLPPPCITQADADSNNRMDIIDITYLAEFLFVSGPSPGACP